MSAQELSSETEDRILEAAERVFYRKGKAGTSMQDIADEAGITRTSLNYYYRSKDKLFEAVFRSTMKKILPDTVRLVNSEGGYLEILPRLVEMIIDRMIENPQIPIFVLQELSSNPGRMPQVMFELGIDPDKIQEKIRSDDNFHRMDMDPRQMILNVISLCIFPFAARSIIQEIFYRGDEQAYIEAMLERKRILPRLIGNSLKKS